MREIPLFPLNTVLFPKMPLPLRIFEERYKQMLAFCVENKSPFGVVLIRSGQAEYDTGAEPYGVGCTAEITQVQPLGGGQSFVMSMGQARFRLLGVKRERPYLLGQIEMMPFADEPETVLRRASERLRPEVQTYLDVMRQMGRYEVEGDLPLEVDNKGLGLLAAALLQVPEEVKQHLLEEPRLSRMMAMLQRLYARENVLLRTMPQEDLAPFSMN